MTGQPSSDPPRALRVKLPLRQHLALHRLKLRTGRSMASVIESALDNYLKDDPEFDVPGDDAPVPA